MYFRDACPERDEEEPGTAKTALQLQYFVKQLNALAFCGQICEVHFIINFWRP